MIIKSPIDLIVLYKRQSSTKRRSEDDIPAVISFIYSKSIKELGRSPEEHLTILVQVVKMHHQQLLIGCVE